MNCENAGKQEGKAPVIRVCILCETWISGGIESFICSVLRKMDRSRLAIDIVVSEIGECIFTQQLQECGVCFLELSGNQRNVMENHRRFRRLIRERCYEVLHINMAQGLSLAYLHIAKQEGVSVRIAHSHNTALRKSLTRPLKLMIHNLSKRQYTKDATELWACSRAAAEFIFDKYELKARGYKFIPNGIEVERFRFSQEIREKKRKELGLDGQFVIGNVGRLCYQKNQAFLLDVLLEVLKYRPNSCLLLVGEGEDKPMLIEKARRLGLLNKVLFYGTTDHVEQLFWAMDVFAFPSRFEGLGISAVEAQASSLPVVCSENIPDETYITAHIHSVPLSAGYVTWAGMLLGASSRSPIGADEVKKSGFDVGKVAAQIRDCYQQDLPN